MGNDCRRDRVEAEWAEGLRAAVLAKAGWREGGAVEAANLIVDFGWKSGTWKNRTSQIRKWLMFCDEEGRDSLPAGEGDVIAYVGYLSLEGRVSPASVPQYLSAVSRFHEDAGHDSPTKTRMISRLVKAYANRKDWGETTCDVRTGIGAPLVRRIVELGCVTQSVDLVRACAMVVFAFVFHCRAVTVGHVHVSDVEVGENGIVATLVRRKGKSESRPLRLTYAASAEWGDQNPVRLLGRWANGRPGQGWFFGSDGLDTAHPKLGDAVKAAMVALGEQNPKVFFYSSHSPRIGALNELVGLQFAKPWIMHRLDWASEGMFQVYFDGRIVPTSESYWFFAHLKGG